MLKTGSLKVQLGAWSLIRYIHYIDQGLSILPLRAFYKASLETFIERTGQLWWSGMLQALLLRPKMGDQIFINNNPFFRRASPLYSPFPCTMNLWNESSDIVPCDLCPPRHGSIFVRVLMAEVRPYSVTRYKYCRNDGVKRVGSEHPNPPPVCWCREWWPTLHSCSEYLVCSIMVSGGGGGSSELQKAKKRFGEIPLHNSVYYHKILSN